jgi:hypothetical protein
LIAPTSCKGFSAATAARNFAPALSVAIELIDVSPLTR